MITTNFRYLVAFIVEGKFSPLFQEENEYEYVVTTLLEFLDFNQFLKMMSSQKHTHKRSHK